MYQKMEQSQAFFKKKINYFYFCCKSLTTKGLREKALGGLP